MTSKRPNMQSCKMYSESFVRLCVCVCTCIYVYVRTRTYVHVQVAKQFTEADWRDMMHLVNINPEVDKNLTEVCFVRIRVL